MNKSGILLIAIGAVFLAHNLGMFEFEWLRQWWPLVLIGFGIWSIVKHKPAKKTASETDEPQS